MDELPNFDLAGDSTCPFCGSPDGCDHLLLDVDVTFRTPEGGALSVPVSRRWTRLLEREEENFDEPRSFRELLEEVDSLSDALRESEIEGGPGMSSACVRYFCSSKENVERAVKIFEESTSFLA